MFWPEIDPALGMFAASQACYFLCQTIRMVPVSKQLERL